MSFHYRKVSITGAIVFLAVIINAIVLRNGLVIHKEWSWGLCFSIPVLFVALYDKHVNDNEHGQ